MFWFQIQSAAVREQCTCIQPEVLEGKGEKKKYQRQINESKQREVKLGRPLGTR